MTTKDKRNKTAKGRNKMQQGFCDSSVDLYLCDKERDERDFLSSFTESNEQGGVGKFASECKIQSNNNGPGKSKS